MYAQNIQDELAALFPGIQFWPSYQHVDLAGDVLNLIIPNQCVNEQGYSISTDRGCQVKLHVTFCTVALRVAHATMGNTILVQEVSCNINGLQRTVQWSPMYSKQKFSLKI